MIPALPCEEAARPRTGDGTAIEPMPDTAPDILDARAVGNAPTFTERAASGSRWTATRGRNRSRCSWPIQVP